jgi:LPXTG-motif cell wall-anchored protein
MKQLISGILLTLALVVTPMTIHAAGGATMSLSASDITVERGDQFDLTVSVHSNNGSLDTVRTVVTFDPSILRAQNASLVGVYDRSAPGNYLDNTSGKVSWGGFTLNGPIDSSSEFVTITFLAIEAGSTTVALSADSRAISNGQEQIDVSSFTPTSVAVENASDADPTLSLLVVSSDTHANDVDWYSATSASFNWVELAGDSPISSYYYDFDQVSNTDPSSYLSGSTNVITADATGDGVWYLHLKGVQADGRETKTTHRQVKIDNTAPNDIELASEDNKILEGESVWLTFATTDETSGVLQYQIAINQSEFQVQTSPLEITDLEPGTYFFRVSALDRAGNSIYGSTSVRVYPEGTDLSRPQGFEETSEIEGIVEGTFGADDDGEDGAESNNILLSLIMGVLIAAGVVYGIKRKKS